MDYTPLTSGNIQYILAFLVVVLASVVVYQNRKIDFLYREKDDLQERRITGTKETIDKYNSAMGDFSQTAKLLLAKLDGEGK